jgi:hypothetical protein
MGYGIWVRFTIRIWVEIVLELIRIRIMNLVEVAIGVSFLI